MEGLAKLNKLNLIGIYNIIWRTKLRNGISVYKLGWGDMFIKESIQRKSWEKILLNSKYHFKPHSWSQLYGMDIIQDITLLSFNGQYWIQWINFSLNGVWIIPYSINLTNIKCYGLLDGLLLNLISQCVELHFYYWALIKYYCFMQIQSK